MQTSSELDGETGACDPDSEQCRGADGPLSVGSIASVASAGSIASVASVGSIASVASAGSIGSVGSAGSIASVGGTGTIFNVPVPAKLVRALLARFGAMRRRAG